MAAGRTMAGINRLHGLYSTVLAPATFFPLTSVNYTPSIGGGIQSATRVTLAAAAGALVTNAAAVKFDFTNPGSENGYCGYDQITLFGVGGHIHNLQLAAVGDCSNHAICRSSSAFDGAITVNLIRADQTSLNGGSVSHGPSIPANFTTAGLNDGSAAANTNYAYYAITEPTGDLPVTITFNLNTNIASGYNITKVQTITGWSDSNLANQSFQLLLSLNGGTVHQLWHF